MPRVLILVLLLLCTWPSRAAEVWLVDIEGAIGPAMADHVIRSIDQANESAPAPELLILRMNTPGGLDRSMRDIIRSILASDVPVASFVAPEGSRAASAGTYILYASHIAAMAPATNLGAATPVQMGGPPLPTDKTDQKTKQPSGDASRQKALNDAIAYIRSLAEKRGRNADWAEKAVADAATLTASAAHEHQVIDLVAKSVPALLTALDGRNISIGEQQRTLATRDAPVTHLQPDWRSQFLQVITNPNIAYLLLMIGVYGIIFELSSPGMGAGGIVGGICLLVAAYALQLLPISYSALGLILLGLGLLAAEAFTPTVGILGLGGVVAFVVGSILLMDSNVPGYQIALPVIIAVAASSVLLLTVVLHLLRKTRYRPVVSGLATLEGQLTEVGRFNGDTPMAKLDGEWWQLRCDDALVLHDRVRVTRAESLVLDVTKES